MQKLPIEVQALIDQIEKTTSVAALDEIEQQIFGRKAGWMTMKMKELSAMKDEAKKKAGQELNAVKKQCEESIAARRQQFTGERYANLGTDDALDLTIDLPKKEHGHQHLVPEFIRTVEEVFGRMGFDTAGGPEIETEELNFNMLNIPDDHPARDAQDTFWISTKNHQVLRTHTSPVQIRYMKDRTPPFRAIFPGKVYRKDSDATHSPMFHQFEGVMIGEDVTMANMKAVMETAVRELVSPTAEFRWRTGYFPFVEPGLEMDMRWQGDESQSREGRWLEICGCGMTHPQVLRNVGIDPSTYQGFAFGFGVERMVMIKHQVPDLRVFYNGDPRFLRQF